MYKTYKQLKCLILSCMGLLMVNSSFGTGFSRQVIVANGGVFGAPGNKVKIGTYNTSTNLYGVFDEFDGNFVSDVIIDNNIAYIAANGIVIKYNIDNYKKLASVSLSGAEHLTIYNNQLIVSRGFGADSQYVQVLNTSDLSLDYSVDEITGQASGVVILNDTAYIGVKGDWQATTGSVAMVDLQSESYISAIDLDTLGKGISKLYAYNDTIYTFNSIQWDSDYGVVSQFYKDGSGLKSTIIDLHFGTPIGTDGGSVFLGLNNAGIGSIKLTTKMVEDTTIISGSFAGGHYDDNSNVIFVSETDYATFGTISMYNSIGTLLEDTSVNIAPEALYADTRSEASNNQPLSFDQTVQVTFETTYPIDLSATISDIDGDTLSIAIVTDVQNGTSSLDEFEITYTPDTDFKGFDTLWYSVCDNGTGNLCDTSMVVFVVNEENIAPNAGDDVANIDNLDSVLIAILKNDADSNDMNILTASIVTNPVEGMAELISNDTIKYISTSATSTVDSFTYEVCDDGLPSLCAEGKVTINFIANPFVESINKETLIAYPNPTKGTFNLQLSNAKQDQYLVSIRTLDGRIAYQGKMSSTAQIDVSHYPVGSYLVYVQSDNYTYQTKLVKQ